MKGSIQTAAERVGPAVVGLGRGWGVGSGVVIAPGRVLTNAHNLRHDEVTRHIRRRPAREPAASPASDPDLDIAVIDVDTAEVEPVEWPRRGRRAGDRARGARARQPRRPWPAGHARLRLLDARAASAAPRAAGSRGAIEHTAPLPRGSSGGPLVDADGRLLGINAVRVDGGLILAIPADAPLRERVEALGRGEAPKRARLGVAIAPPRVARRLRRAVGLPERDGVLVRGGRGRQPG